MGKRRKHRRRESAAKRPVQRTFQEEMLDRVLGRWLIPPPNPVGFGIERAELRSESPLVTGAILFDDPFHTVLPPPPFGKADPCYPAWINSVRAAEARITACPPGQESPECDAAREAYYESARQYADCMDLHYGLQRFQPAKNRT